MVLQVSSTNIKKQMLLVLYELFQKKKKEKRKAAQFTTLTVSLDKHTWKESTVIWETH